MNSKHLGNYTLGQIESLYHQGLISQDQWEGYCHAWQTGAVRFGGEFVAYGPHPGPGPVADVVAVIGCGCS